MNQHQLPPCRLAILFIRRKVPPRKVDVDANASFCDQQHTPGDLPTERVGPNLLRNDLNKGAGGGLTMLDNCRLLSRTSLPIPDVIWDQPHPTASVWSFAST